MDYGRVLRELYDQRARLDRAIGQLEGLASGSSVDGGPKRRGRKSMGAEERKAVSLRIKAYWAARRRDMK
jgi:hypothetical protein